MKFTLVCLTFLIIILLPQESKAHSISGEPAGFNHTNLISDADFLRSNNMSANAINNFLAAKGSWMANYTIPEHIDVPYFCRNDAGNPETRTVSVRQLHVAGFPVYGMRVADLLAERAVTMGINPQVMMVLIERESSGITRSAPSSNMTRAWPLFYNFDEVMASYGYTCPVAEQKAIDFGGIGLQIAYGTYGVKKMYNDVSDWQNPITIDGVTFTSATRSTRALYRYTPHIHNGNHNFWYFFTVWFGARTCSDLSLIKGSDPAVFAVKNGVRYHVSSLETLFAWGMQCLTVETVSDAALATYPMGNPLTRLIREADGVRVFIVTNGMRRHIRSPLYIHYFGVADEPIASLPSDVIESISQGPPLGYLVKAIGQPEIYLTQLHGKIYVPDIPTLEAWGFYISELIEVHSSYLDPIPTVGRLSVLVKGPGPEIYVASNRRFVYVPSLQRMRDWALENTPVTYIDGVFLDILPRQGVLSQITRGSGDPIYYITGGKRHHLTTPSAAQRYDSQYGPLIRMADTLISRIPFAGTLN